MAKVRFVRFGCGLKCGFARSHGRLRAAAGRATPSIARAEAAPLVRFKDPSNDGVRPGFFFSSTYGGALGRVQRGQP